RLIEDEVTKQWGKRASSKYSRINGLIPSDLKKQFKAKVALDGSDISKKIEELIRDYVNS
ncbi:MAG: hypothetical protein KC422_25445, partial [Trueperaceae bacterium]|nr:hypothetical protein [Trueperaceae bacterium]